MKLIKVFVCILNLILLFYCHLHPWGSTTHSILVDNSVLKSIPFGSSAEKWLKILSLDRGYFYKYFNYENNAIGVMQMITNGAVLEDNQKDSFTLRRSDNHFHNPLKYFYEAGLSDYFDGKSMAVWAQDGANQEPYPEGDQSWERIRAIYYDALVSTNEKEKIIKAGLLLKGIGHQIHIIHDAAVPDHVRNDAHILNGIPFDFTKKLNGSFRCIEGWADWNANMVYQFSDQPIYPKTVFEHIKLTTAIPISNLIDSNIYDGTNPTSSMEQGLAEFTNSNFISEDTICTNELDVSHKHYFPYPRYSSTNLEAVKNNETEPELITAFDNKTDYVRYIKKEGDGETVNHFLKLGYFSTANPLVLKKALFIDDLCHKDYASILLPRAVGYSAALINYFFRGEIEVSIPENDGIYSFCFVPAEGFKKISLMARNISPGTEEMKNGTISLVLSYRLGNGTPYVPNPPYPNLERKYKIFQYANPGDPNNKTDIPRDVPIRLDFDMASDPLPTDAVDVTLTLLFKGDLGAEKENAVAVGFKDLSEPTPIDMFNNTDKVCFNGEYVNYDDVNLWNYVDVNPENGQIDCTNNAEIDITRQRIGQQSKEIFVYFSFNGKPASSSNYYFKYDEGWEIMPGETPYRMFVLADSYPAKINFSALVRSQSIEDPLHCFKLYSNESGSYDPYTNKLEWIDSIQPGESHFAHIHSPIGYFRGYPFWILNYFNNVSIPENSECAWEDIAQTQAPAGVDTDRPTGNPQRRQIKKMAFIK